MKEEEEEEEEEEESLFIASAVNEDSSEQEVLWKEEVRSARGPGGAGERVEEEEGFIQS